MIELVCGPHTARVDDEHGGRVASLRLAGREVLVTAAADSLGWGSYPMVPYAGRVRNGRFTFEGRTVQLPLRMPPHAIHGTVLDNSWTVVAADSTSCVLSTAFGSDWPYSGRIDHAIALTATSLHHELTIHANEVMPVQIGWHPWFVKPRSSHLRFRAMHRRDASGIAEPFESPIPHLEPGTIDDCFVDPQEVLTLHHDDVSLELTSTCRYWVVYDHPGHATCVEPQSGPPDGLNHAPDVARPHVPWGHSFTVTWTLR